MIGIKVPVKVLVGLVIIILCLMALSDGYAIGQSKYGKIEKFPYQVMLIGKQVWRKRILCGGTLLDKRWILSAAHCTIGVTHFDVFLGTKSVADTIESGLIMRSNKFIAHEHFNPITAANDIALIKLPDDVKFSSRIQPAILPYNRKYDEFTGSRAVASGWGATEEMTNSDSMQYTELRVISNKDCSEEYDVVTAGVLCAKGLKDETVCSGDSGGPLVLRGTQMIIGITSFGPADGCETNIPGGFTRVTYYLKWIESKIGHSLQKTSTPSSEDSKTKAKSEGTNSEKQTEPPKPENSQQSDSQKKTDAITEDSQKMSSQNDSKSTNKVESPPHMDDENKV